MSVPATAFVGDAANRVALVGMDTSVLDFYAGQPFNRNICLFRDRHPNSRSAECEKACACEGYPPSCLRTPTWDAVVRTMYPFWAVRFVVDMANEFYKQAQWATSGYEPPPAHTLPPNAWDHISRVASVGLCAVNLINAVVQTHAYAAGGGCQDNYLMALEGMDVFCHVAFAVAACGEVLRYAGPAYGAYVSSGAQGAIAGIAGSCGAGKFIAEQMKCAVSRRACLAAVDMGRGVDFSVDRDGNYRPNQCCYCNRQLMEDRWWPRRDRAVGPTEAWGSVVSSAERDLLCEGRPGRKFRSADPAGRRSLYYRYWDCRRGEPSADGRCGR